VHDTTTAVFGGANRPLTGATRSFLLKRLGARTGHLTAVLDLVSSLAGSGALGDHHLVNQGDIGLHVKQLGGQLNRTSLLARGVENVNSAHP